MEDTYQVTDLKKSLLNALFDLYLRYLQEIEQLERLAKVLILLKFCLLLLENGQVLN